MQKLVKKGWNIPIGLVAIIGYFVFRAIDRIITILPLFGPDGGYHFDLINLYSTKIGFLNIRDIGDIGYGNIFDVPYLYHFVMGKLLWLNVFPISDYQFLQFIHLVIWIAILLYVYKLAKIFIKDNFSVLVLMFIITNIPQISFNAVSPTYDIAVILTGVMSAYYAAMYVTSDRPKCLIIMSIALMVGALSKVTILPLIPVYLLALTMVFRRSIYSRLKAIIRELVRNRFLLFLFSFVASLNVYLYGFNIIKYGSLLPTCMQVLGADRCYYSAMGNIQETLAHINLPVYSLGFFEFIAGWVYNIIYSAFWRDAVISIIPEAQYGMALVGVVLGLIIVLIYSYRTKVDLVNMLFLLVVFLYSILLVVYVSYPISKSTGTIMNADFRYTYPIVVLWFLLVVKAVYKSFSKEVRTSILVTSMIILFLFDYPYLKSHTPRDTTYKWYKETYGKNAPIIRDRYIKYYHYNDNRWFTCSEVWPPH